MAKLPRSDRSIVDPNKVREYLLSTSHPIGRFKAAFFRALGYAESDWARLIADIRLLADSGEAVAGHPSSHGQKYEVRGTLTGPSGRRAAVVTVWIIPASEDAPRLVTVYPGDER